MPAARRIDDRYPAGPVDIEYTGHTKQRRRVENERVEEIVVDAAIKNVDPLQPLSRLHAEKTVDNDEIGAFDQLDTHLVGQERVFEIGAVIDAGRQQRDRRLGIEVSGRDAFERLQEGVRIIFDRPHPIAAEEVGEEMHHRLAVLQHIGDAGRRARIVFKDHELVLAGADEIDADDVTVDAARRVDTDHLGQEGRVLGDELFGNLATFRISCRW